MPYSGIRRGQPSERSPDPPFSTGGCRQSLQRSHLTAAPPAHRTFLITRRLCHNDRDPTRAGDQLHALLLLSFPAHFYHPLLIVLTHRRATRTSTPPRIPSPLSAFACLLSFLLSAAHRLSSHAPQPTRDHIGPSGLLVH